MPFSWSLSRLAISLIGCILIGRRFSFSCAGRLRHNQSHLWTHRSFSLPGCRAVVILVARSLSIVGRPAQRTKRPADRQTEQQEQRHDLATSDSVFPPCPLPTAALKEGTTKPPLTKGRPRQQHAFPDSFCCCCRLLVGG